ncbi:MAG: metal ABC transporter substrate-binding protein [Acidobacteria bacterium]|nr:metal ABC transporter substrate-binding protein [Acidobacteriota bacterium]
MKDQPSSPAAWLLAALLFLSPGAARGEEKKSLVLAATIFPAADIVRRVAGPEARVIQVLPPGASPHTFDLTPGQVRQLQDVRLVFKIGGIDDWIDGIAESLPRAAMVTLDKDIALRPAHEDGHRHDGHGPGHEQEHDPHYWLSAANGAIMARTVAAALAAHDPVHAGRYRENYRRLAGELSALHGELQRELARLENRNLIVFHDGWRYFAAAYGLRIAAVFQPAPGREPTPRELQGLYAQARRLRIKAVFSEPQLPATSLQPLLRDLGLRLVVLDPLGGAAAGDSYAALLRRIAYAVRQGLEN